MDLDLIFKFLKKNMVPLLVWASPWFIIISIGLKYYPEISLDSFNHDKRFAMIVIIMFFFYLYISVLSFNGMFSGVLKRNNSRSIESTIRKPIVTGVLPEIGNILINRLRNQKNSTTIAIAICLRDYIIDTKLIQKCPELYFKAPSINQIKKYPFDSIRLILSFYYIIHTIENDPYYNFDSAIDACIKTIDKMQ